MKVTTPDGRRINVRRRWLPWRRKLRQLEDTPDLGVTAVDDVLAVVAAIVFLLFLAVLVEALVVLLLAPLLLLARVVLGLPWTVEVLEGSTVLGTERVRGWSDATVRIHELADSYERGDDPFQHARTISSS
ncbi:MAG TPA: hypothetical protein VFK41_02460 [Nocardioidaceae bacterium]|nr:hypothetical protein [Nocardioidaceae bacterium]